MSASCSLLVDLKRLSGGPRRLFGQRLLLLVADGQTGGPAIHILLNPSWPGSSRPSTSYFVNDEIPGSRSATPRLSGDDLRGGFARSDHFNSTFAPAFSSWSL